MKDRECNLCKSKEMEHTVLMLSGKSERGFNLCMKCGNLQADEVYRGEKTGLISLKYSNFNSTEW